jgi:signal transduction histidine kinase
VDAWHAIRRRRFLLTTWPWRALLHTVTTLVVWSVFVMPVIVLGGPFGAAVEALVRGQVVAAAGLLLLGVVLALVTLPLLATPLVALDRWRARLVDPRPLPPASRPPVGAAGWLRDRWLTPRRWREAGYLVVVLVLDGAVLAAVCLLGTSAVVMVAAPVLATNDAPVNIGAWKAGDPLSTTVLALLGVLLLGAVAYAWTAGACLQTGLLRRTLEAGRRRELTEELTEVEASRARLVESFDSERRRIERDLHDGAQQRLVALAMRLGIVRMEVTDTLGADHSASVDVAIAHEQAKELMEELRAFVRGIHPQVLTDVGLVAALDQLTAGSPLPVSITSSLERRTAAPVETTAYFATSEALTNVARHSGATRASITIDREGQDLVVEVRDDGHGGATPRPDSGLTWIADRLAAVGGTLALSSPVGGPTLVRMRIPESTTAWGSS